MEWTSPFDNINQLTQGSIVDAIDWGNPEDNPVGIILSNACDLAHEGHCSYLIVAAMYPAQMILQSSREYKGIIPDPTVKLTRKQLEKRAEYFSNYIHHKTINRYYFIDCTETLLGMHMVIDFQRIISMPHKCMHTLKPIAHLVSPLREQMIMQFAHYTARIPSDRVDEEQEANIIETLCGA
jgi:hypothetical protein